MSFFFFFSSRRRHTRWTGDWSSDVCSSDLVRPGTITSVIGPNGAGKTTAFNAITGYLLPARGEIAWEGAALTGLRPSAVAKRGIVRTFQRTSVFPALSVTDNVRIGLHLSGTA